MCAIAAVMLCCGPSADLPSASPTRSMDPSPQSDVLSSPLADVPPVAPTPTGESWYGIRGVPVDELKTVAANLGGTVVAIGVDTESAAQVNAMLDRVHALSYRALVIMYTRETCSRRPWEWNGREWVFPQAAVETLQGIARHPALLAVYALHEPFDYTNDCHWTVAQQRELYRLLRNYTDGVPVWSDIGTPSGWEKRGVRLVDGICDYCGTNHHCFRSDWPSERSVRETLETIDADLDTQRRLMPHSQLVFQIQTFSYNGNGYSLRLPTPDELQIVRDHLHRLGQPMLYYPWSHGAYDATLKDAPELWSVVSDRTTMPPLPIYDRFRCTATGPRTWRARRLPVIERCRSCG